ncbi:MAG: Methyl-accepting chemotaxis protein PctA [Planctomycetota bacterium]
MRVLLSPVSLLLVLCFLLATLAPLGAVYLIWPSLSDGAIERAAVASMASVAEAKGAQLDAYARERIRNVSSVSSGLAFVGAAQELSPTYAADATRDQAAYDAVLAKYKARIDDFAKVCECSRFMIVDASGRVVYSTAETDMLHRSLRDSALSNTGLARAIERVRNDRTAQISPPSLAVNGVTPPLEVVGPLLKNDAVVGFAVLTLSTDEINKIVSDYTGLGRTGDIIGAVRVGNEMLYTTPTRTNPDAAYVVHYTFGTETSRRLQDVLYGSPCRGQGTDDEGHDVFGAWVRIPSLRWGLSVTQHVDEAYELSRRQQDLVKTVAIYSIGPAFLLALLMSFWVAVRAKKSGVGAMG